MSRSLLPICQTLTALFLLTLRAVAVEWTQQPLNPADLALQKGRVDPNAEAECLLWDVRVNNEFQNHQDALTTYTHFIRIKIFNDAGVKNYGTVDLAYNGKEQIADISGRTIQSDGTVLELKKDAVFDHILEKLHRSKTRALSFAMPGVKPGVIIEYRYKVFEDKIWNYVPLDAQMEIPIERLIFHVKPLSSLYTTDRMAIRTFHMDMSPFKNEMDGFQMTGVNDIPAFHPEPDAPPDREVQRWVLIYYSPDSKEDVERFWKREGKRQYQLYSEEVKVNGEVKQIAEEVTTGAKSDDEKLAKIYFYCQQHLKNVFGHAVSDAERQSFKPNKNTADTLKKAQGTGYDITLAFIALAQAAGYESRLALMEDRDMMIFRKEAMMPYFNVHDAAVYVGGKWRFYDPATLWLGPGQIRWQEQGIEALIADPKEPQFVPVPVTPAEESLRKQAARLKLNEEGTLEGEVEETFTGLIAAEWRAGNFDLSEGAREKAFTDEVKFHLAGAEVTEAKLSDPANVTMPVSLRCHVKVENFATRTGKRLFFTPAIFQINHPVRYTEASRTYDFLYRHPWSETEAVSIGLPEGFQLDHPDIAQPLAFDPVGRYQVKAIVTQNRLLYQRDFVFGKNGSIFFPSTVYPTLKKIFDVVHDNDAHLLTLKQQPTMAEAH